MRRIRPQDGPLLKRVRLAALLDSPSAFGRTHAEEVEFGDAEWARRAHESAAGTDRCSFFAELAGEVVGLVGGHRTTGVTELVSMWVDPAIRGGGVGSALVEAVVDWAGGDVVDLWVTRGNDPAVALYERAGFVVTNDVQASPSDPCAEEIRMRRSGG